MISVSDCWLRKPTGPVLLPSARWIVAGALGIRLAFLVAFHIHSVRVGQGGFNAAPYGGLDDGRYYYETAMLLANDRSPDYVLNAFPLVLAQLMRWGITDLLTLKLISFVVSSVSVVLGARLAYLLTSNLEEWSRRIAVLAFSLLGALFPSNIFWSTNSMMRDGWILSFVMVFVWSLYSDPWDRRPYKVARRVCRLAVGLAALLLAASFRPYVIAVALAAWACMYKPWANPMRSTPRRIGPAIVRIELLALTFIVGCLVAAPLIDNLTGFDILAWRSRPELLDKGSSMGYYFVDSPWWQVIPQYLYSALSNAFGPFPWQISVATQMLVFVEFPFFALILWRLPSLRYDHPLLRFCGLFGLYWLLLLGLWNDVLGNALRNRVIAWPVIAIVSAVAIGRWAQYRTAMFQPWLTDEGRAVFYEPIENPVEPEDLTPVGSGASAEAGVPA